MCLIFSIREKDRIRNWAQCFSLTPWLEPGINGPKADIAVSTAFLNLYSRKPLKRLGYFTDKSTWLKPVLIT
jgi:hypothetical protein